mmetsp:Transcript_7235/g.13715  ORF Transcript_7235/g.13715 Transcript_7235/m.13715 type:complete len:240 (+) Transcript_7235:686-1405(+)
MPTHGAMMSDLEIFSNGCIWSLSVLSKRRASGPHVVWLSRNTKLSQSRVKFISDEIRKTWDNSSVRNSRMRARFTLNSNMMVHLRWCCCKSFTWRLEMASCISFIATENSVMVQLRVLKTRFRKAPNKRSLEVHVSQSRRWKTADAHSDPAAAEALAEPSPGWLSRCPKPEPLTSRSRMLEMGIQNRPSNDSSKEVIMLSRAARLASNTPTYSLYCISTEMDCRSTSRTSGLTMRASLK